MKKLLTFLFIGTLISNSAAFSFEGPHFKYVSPQSIKETHPQNTSNKNNRSPQNVKKFTGGASKIPSNIPKKVIKKPLPVGENSPIQRGKKIFKNFR